MIYFFDTSALIKRYINETGTNWVSSVTEANNGNTIFIAQITQVEVTSGIARLKRDGSLSPEMAQSARTLFDRHVRREYNLVSLTRRIVHRAQDLLDAHPLRAYDAVQLASAIESHMQLSNAPSQLIFVSADLRLLTAAKAEGLATHQPA